jgi:hypothetical protein
VMVGFLNGIGILIVVSQIFSFQARSCPARRASRAAALAPCRIARGSACRRA